MSSSAPDTQGQLTVAKLAQCLNAGLIEADVDALESGSAVSSLEPLTSARAAMRAGAGLVNCGLHLGLLVCHGRHLSGQVFQRRLNILAG